MTEQKELRVKLDDETWRVYDALQARTGIRRRNDVVRFALRKALQAEGGAV